MIDRRLVGYWSERELDPSSVEVSELGFRDDGTGWLYWSSWSSSFSVARFAWQVATPGRLTARIHLTLNGTWSFRGDLCRHDVEEQESDPTVITLGYSIAPGQDSAGAPATLLTCDQPIDGYLAGTRFALARAGITDDPTLSDADSPR